MLHLETKLLLINVNKFKNQLVVKEVKEQLF
jgi:hypothetical protein